jgi:hypothetical protein
MVETMTSVETPMPTFDDLTKVGKTLNEQSNQINQILQDFEKKLAEMNLGVEAWLDEWEPNIFLEWTSLTVNGVQHEHAWVLGYAEHGQKYRLMAKELTGYYDKEETWRVDEGEYRFLLSAPRKHRVKALELIEPLLGELQHEAQRVLDAIQKGRKTVENL